MNDGEGNQQTKAFGSNLSAGDFRPLAEFRYRITQFVHFSEETSRSKSIEAQQHQLLLAVKGLRRDTRPTMTALSHQLCFRHYSTAELVDSIVDRHAVRRRHGDQNQPEVLVDLTPGREALLHRLSVLQWEDLRRYSGRKGRELA